MTIKTIKKVDGLPFGRVTASPGVAPNGASQVLVVLSALDIDIPEVVTRLALSASEARELANRLIASAAVADAQAKADPAAVSR